ncbi:carboxylating nicotinate-nucleotide diphosphorylase [Spirulina sp. 06S082]|uniref:carboxylating nicotinate-nucleotide diphosphorylase n=1 Tax=Spirulina sp. 06S082 TaxID=3110248 RepID=UPI002B1FB42C|nr:carboxylating nicotinate-nucleotide diphosphorylase [Spirulina sp. 06S082]MEA5467420.1 carboxylating nicotinate-nucleotide diphosphorylase [Spirulina sp. 06S082]
MILPPWIVLDPSLKSWLLEDIGRGDRATQGLLTSEMPWGKANWIVKETGMIAGLPIAARIFHLLNPEVRFTAKVKEGECCSEGTIIAALEGPFDALLMGERVALNLTMRLSGIASATRQYVEAIATLPARFVDTRKTTPGLRLLEKYATGVGGAINHRMGLDDAAMIKDNHIQAAGGIGKAIAQVRATLPYPLTIEVETSNISEVREALEYQADIIMLDNMTVETMGEAVKIIRDRNPATRIEASGNITLKTIYPIAETGVDYISSSAPITRSPWLDLSMKLMA